jgi:hypothetical protein
MALRRRRLWCATAGAAFVVLLQAASAPAHHSFAAEYDVEAIGASHGG